MREKTLTNWTESWSRSRAGGALSDSIGAGKATGS